MDEQKERILLIGNISALAHTDPTNAHSRLDVVLSLPPNGGAPPYLNWSAPSGTAYRVQRCTNLTRAAWVDVVSTYAFSNMTFRVPGTNSDSPQYYRLNVRPPADF